MYYPTHYPQLQDGSNEYMTVCKIMYVYVVINVYFLFFLFQ